MMMRAMGLSPAGQRIITVRKAADESVTSSTSLQDDDELKFTVEANSNYIFQICLSYTAGTTGDIKFDITVPAGATLVSDWHYTIGVAVNLGNVAASTSVAMDGGGATSLSAIINGSVAVGATAGTVTLRFAQNTSDGTASTVELGSFLWATRVVS